MLFIEFILSGDLIERTSHSYSLGKLNIGMYCNVTVYLNNCFFVLT